jgi:hypothetical protein
MASAPRSDDLLELLTAPRVDAYALLELALEWDGSSAPRHNSPQR